MASKKTLNAKNLEGLGARRLSELLIELSTGDASAKRFLRLELAGELSPIEVGREVTKRLNAISRATTFIHWQNRKPLVDDLNTQLNAITKKIAPNDPAEAERLLWRFLGIAESVYERSDDSSGIISGIFCDASDALGKAAFDAKSDPEDLAEQVFQAIQRNGYGQVDGIIETLAPALGDVGLNALKTKVESLAPEPVVVPPKDEWEVVAWGSNGKTYAHEMWESSRDSTVKRALKDIADAQGDVDAFISQYDTKTRRVPAIAADIGARLLAAGRAEDALGFIERAETSERGWAPPKWHDVRIETLEALGRSDDAQSFRWQRFEQSLDEDSLKAYLKKQPAFEDMKAEKRALEFASNHPSFLTALRFLTRWPAPDRAAALVERRAPELDGNYYQILSPSAERLEEKHPLAAMLVLRSMIDFTLIEARPKRYGHAARHLKTCDALAEQITSYGAHISHQTYMKEIRAKHGRKSGFWGKYEG
ncbi:DUF6880 family protein [Sulfitobacter sp.]|uniref:DUF6880 family protein n=1 Tax=Sulfitobacter sp. TaxID=1903071 RepID=UPI0030032E52